MYEIIKFEKNGTKDFAPFKYEFHKSKLVHDNAWPTKTYDVSELNCEITLKKNNKKKRSYRLQFLDFPGERTADFLMYSSSYSEWSDHVFASMQADCSYSRLSQEFNFSLSDGSEDDLILSYKTFLGHAICQRYSRMVTPSIYLLDSEGTRPELPGSPEEWAKNRFVGLSEQDQFVPLPYDVRITRKKLASTFEQRYQKYKNTVVMPLVNWLKGANQLYVLVDVQQLLMGGPSMYNDEQCILDRVLTICEKKDGLLSKSWGLLFSKINRVGLIATKSDLVATNDDVDNMESLVKQMAYKKLRGITGTKYSFFTCASVCSTERSGQGKLKGRCVYDENGEIIPQPQSFPVAYPAGQVPEYWPIDDEWEGFNFCEVYPKFSARRDALPQQQGLERVVKYMLGI